MTTDDSADDKAWAMAMIERVQRGGDAARERRDELADAVDALADGFTALGMARWQSSRSREARTDAATTDVTLGSRTESVARIIKYESTVNILSAADQLRGFAVLLRAEVSLMGAVAVARGVFEACLWATAVIDPTVSGEERLQRALARRLARLSAAVRLKKLLGEDTTDEDQVDELDGDEDQHGANRDPRRT